MKPTRQHRREARLLWKSVTADGVPDAERIRAAVQTLPQQIGRNAEPVLRCLAQRLEVYIRSNRIHIVSADPLSPEQRQQLAGRTEGAAALAGVEFSVDPAVLGGLRFEQGYQVTDSTLARQLDVLKDMLLQH
ncbi:F0F1 ATP synthase subunit delta [Pontiella sp.]|uniref:F0F1 ATP synthase subunit delta n=1 Tax=Pontiella sp. TaxID=2837462 RepID=UPI003567DD77